MIAVRLEQLAELEAPAVDAALGSRDGEPERGSDLVVGEACEIANDTVGGVPVAVTFCPLCNTALVFDRRVQGRTLDFGVSGNLRNSDLVMYDRQTESWWQQFGGRALAATSPACACGSWPRASSAGSSSSGSIRTLKC